MPVMDADPADAGLLVALLGPVEIGPAGGVMAGVAQPRLRVLLGLLAVAAGRVVSTEALVDGVWGEDWSPGRERNLHSLVYQLRRRLAAVEPGAGPGQGGARLVRAGGGYRLVLGTGALDVTVFQDLAGRGRAAARAGDTAGARELFGQALGVWRGAALADAAGLCSRLAGEAARLEDLRLAVVEERIGCDLALGAHGEVAGELAELVAEFPLRERLAALLMTALYRCGRRGEALAVYDTARRVLAGQLGLDPGPELAGLQAKVLADDPDLAAPAPPVPAPVAVPGSPTPESAGPGGVVPRQAPAGAFVGRAEELGRLEAVGRAAVAGDAAAVLVVGEPGAGKSRLLAEAAKRIPLGRQFWVAGYEPERQVPFAAAADLLRALAGLGGAGRRLGELVFDAPRGEVSALEPVRILEAAHVALRAAGPAVVLADDLQWVDGLSVALCHYLVRAAEISGAPLALIAAGRPSANDASLSASLAQVLPAQRLARLELGPLASGEALELVRSLAPGLGDAQAREVASLAGGSPFWLEALVRTGGAAADAGRLVTARLRGASADAGAVVALLAVVGRPLGVADLARLNGWQTGRAEHAVQEVVARGLAVESAAVVRMAHDLVRAAVVRDVPEEHRVGIHGRIGRRLAGIAGEDVRRLREALAHMHAAGLPSLDLAGRVVRSPQRTLLGEDGLALVAAVADQADPYDQAVLRLNQEIAVVASALGRHDVALERSLVVADRGRDRSQRARALAQAARSAFALNDSDASRAYVERARATLTGDELFDLELDIHLAALDLWSDDRQQLGQALAHDAGQRARRLFQAGEHVRALHLEALRVEYEAALQQDDLATMVRAAEDRAAIARGYDEESYLTASLAGACAMRRIGRLDEARQRARRVLDEAQRRVLPRLALESGYWLGTLLIESGRIADAEDVVSGAQELASRIGDEARGRHSIEHLASELDFYSGDWRAGIERLLAYAEGASHHARVELHRLPALWLALAGGEALAGDVLAQLEAARAAADRAGCARCAAALRLSAADALAHVRRRAQAAESLAEWRRMQPHPQPHDSYVERRVEALLREPVAAELLEAAAHEAEELGFGLDALWTGLDLGAALAQTDRERAKEVLTRVAQTAGERGALTVRELAGRRLRALGVRTWRRGSGSGVLTEREQVIAHLIAAGASNPEIAQRLFLSRKTVERHVSNVLRKAGVRNRAELAARVAKLEGEGAHR